MQRHGHGRSARHVEDRGMRRKTCDGFAVGVLVFAGQAQLTQPIRLSGQHWRKAEVEGEIDAKVTTSRFDANAYDKAALGDSGFIHVVPDDEWAEGTRALTNETQKMRLAEGTFWQIHEMFDALFDTLSARDAGFAADVLAAFNARGLPTQILEWRA